MVPGCLLHHFLRQSNPLQQRSLLRSLNETFCITIGPPGTGKTKVAAMLIIASALAGKRVGVVAQTNAALRELLVKVKDILYFLNMLESLHRLIIWNRSRCGDDAKNSDEVADILTLPTLPPGVLGDLKYWAQKATRAIKSEDEDNPNKVRNVIMQDFLEAKSKTLLLHQTLAGWIVTICIC